MSPTGAAGLEDAKDCILHVNNLPQKRGTQVGCCSGSSQMETYYLLNSEGVLSGLVELWDVWHLGGREAQNHEEVVVVVPAIELVH